MKKLILLLVPLALLIAGPAYSEDAMKYFNLGVQSSVTRKKIEYYTKALELDPNLVKAYEKRGLLYAIFAECPVPWTGMNASGEVRGGEAIPSLAKCREAALLRKSERKLRRFTPRCPDLWSGSFT
jgi:hypothetical protein